jgi:hypothetical protein
MPSTRTILILGLALALPIVVLALISLASLDPVVVSDIADVAIIGCAAAFIFWAATRFPRSVRLRSQLELLGLGAFGYAVGSLIWTYDELVVGQTPAFPGPPDIGFVIGIACLSAAVWSVLVSVSELLSIRRPLLIAAALSLIAAAILYFLVFDAMFADPSVTRADKAALAFYPLADIFLLFMPTMTLALITGALGSRELSLQWWLLIVGFWVLLVTDVAYAIAEWAGVYASGSPIDAGWWCGYLVLAGAASFAVDLDRMPTPLEATEASSSA